MDERAAKESIGKMVMSIDAGYKCIASTHPHGPYKLLKVTRAGYAILEGREDLRVPLELLVLANK